MIALEDGLRNLVPRERGEAWLEYISESEKEVRRLVAQKRNAEKQGIQPEEDTDYLLTEQRRLLVVASRGLAKEQLSMFAKRTKALISIIDKALSTKKLTKH